MYYGMGGFSVAAVLDWTVTEQFAYEAEGGLEVSLQRVCACIAPTPRLNEWKLDISAHHLIVFCLRPPVSTALCCSICEFYACQIPQTWECWFDDPFRFGRAKPR